MKVSPLAIFRAHFGTLKNLNEERISRLDLVVFFGVPIACGLASWYLCINLSEDVFSASISVFAIFSALLFSVQVAMYGVFRSDRKATGDRILDGDEKKLAEETRKLLREINANVSYLILLSCMAVTIFLVFFSASISNRLEAAILIAVYTHFLLTVSMVLKRAHEVFDSEYAKPLQFKE
ncbi:hypothetical protein [Pseudooceanicola nitratireducens]|uniref:hypothetical protein n=1 Tax=Pseudooceanicola nitratireducens TaxID=517719 RepID=UPI0023F3975E|nr:hypothetical protein [Pseudooceanicola nitratireducens]